MKRIHIAIAACMALLALTATTGIASGAEATKILPEPAEANPVLYISISGRTQWQTRNGNTVICRKDRDLGRFITPNIGVGSILFEECTSAAESVCTGAGDATGTITQEGSVRYLLALEMLTSTTSTLIPAFVSLVKQFHFTCTNNELGLKLLVLSRGCVAGKTDGGEALQSKVSVLFEAFTKGENKILSVLPPEATTESKCLLETSITEEVSGEKFELTALTGEDTLEGWQQSGVSITVLLMN
jgi:hypothetical protein